MARTVTLAEVRERTVEDLLQEVTRAHESLRVVMGGGGAVEIREAVLVASNSDTPPTLPPLPVFDGYVPEGWKDAIYEHSAPEPGKPV